MHHILGNKVLEYDVDDRGVIVDEREIDRTVNHKPNIADWVKEHMVFWYDMAKPVDTYSQNFNDWRLHPSVNADIIITSTSFVITRFATLNDTVKCYIPDQTKNFPGMKVEVKGIVDGQELYWGYSADVKLVNITSDGTYDIPPLETVNGNLSFRNGNIVGACNITITQLPSGQSVPTNEILKTNPYLQDFSGNNRPLKLNNFLFAAMSGVGGKEVYPNALVTDGVDDYGVVENLQHGVKVLFTTINPFVDGKFIYNQRLNTTEPWLFAVFNDKGSIAYNSRNSNGKTYIDGTLNESTIVSALLNKKQIITIVNNDVTGDKTKTPIFFSNTDHNSGWISSAFYNSIGFDSVPTKQNDGFTEQDLIDYVLENLITK